MKLKRLLSGLLVSLIAIVGIAMFTKVSNAAESYVKYQQTSTTAISAVEGSIEGGVATFKNTFTSNKEQITKNNTMTFKLTGIDVTITKIVLSTHTNASKGAGSITIKVGDVVAYNAEKYSKAYSTAYSDYEFSVDSLIGDIEIVLKCTTNSLYCESFTIYYDTTAPTDYRVSFDAGNATFATGKGQAITTAVGNDTIVPLPKIDDLVYGCKELMPLAGWSDGTDTHKPGEEVTVSGATQFTAVYSENNSKTLSVAEARSVCDFVGSEPTTKMFSVKGVVSEINKTVVVIKDESNSELSLTLYKPETDSVEAGIKEGDKIIGTGNLLLFNSNTYELNTGCTYVKVQPTTEELFESLEIKNQLSYHWSTTDSETYTIDNVSLRFGVELTEAMTALEGAKFGAFVSNSASIIGNIETAIELEATTAAAVVDMEDTIGNLEFANIAAPGGMTSIRIDNLDANLTGNIYVVIYMEYNGKLYITAEKVASVKSVATTYLASDIELTADQIGSLRQITE